MTYHSDPNKTTFSASPYRSLRQPVSSGRFDPNEPRSIVDILMSPILHLTGSRVGQVALIATATGALILALS